VSLAVLLVLVASTTAHADSAWPAKLRLRGSIGPAYARFQHIESYFGESRLYPYDDVAIAGSLLVEYRLSSTMGIHLLAFAAHGRSSCIAPYGCAATELVVQALGIGLTLQDPSSGLYMSLSPWGGLAHFTDPYYGRGIEAGIQTRLGWARQVDRTLTLGAEVGFTLGQNPFQDDDTVVLVGLALTFGFESP
jgi:hypothetical protein